MFDILAQYLFEFKELALPPIGRFELQHKGASADLASSTIAAPAWTVGFKPYEDTVAAGDRSVLLNWLASRLNGSRDDVERRLEHFVADLQMRLNKGESVNWHQLGILEKKNGQIQFEPALAHLSPFTDIAVKKISREHTSHQTLVGDRETTTAQMREQLQLPEEKRRSSSTLTWIVLGIALLAAAWFFSQKGCNLSASGNQQKVESAKPGDTYKLR